MSDRTQARPGRVVFGAGGVHRFVLRSQRQRILHAALDAGFRDFDVAPSYGNGLNELELGLAIRGLADARVITKFGIPFDPYGARHPHTFTVRRALRVMRRAYRSEYSERDYAPGAMRLSLEKSLRRLRQDRVDQLMIHEPVEPLSATQIDDLAGTATALAAEGKINRFGIAGPARSIGSVAAHESIDVVQTLLADAHREYPSLDKPVTAFGVYRYFAALTPDSAESFTRFISRELSARPGLRLIVTSQSPQRIASFRELNG